MSDEANERPQRFERRRRTEPPSTGETRAKFIDCLDDIESYLDEARRGGREGFAPRTGRYAAASLAIVRAASLFENSAFASLLADVPDLARRGIVTTRNIVAHAGYVSMDDDLFWRTIDIDMPPLLALMRTA